MKRVLVTGATGTVGIEVVHYLSALPLDFEIYAAVRHIKKAKKALNNYHRLQLREFDFEKEHTFFKAFDQIDILFLLRPPHISDVNKVFKPLLIAAREKGIRKVVFLSVQGAERSKAIPHNRIEALITELSFDFIFVRPSYFMQNLTTTLLPEILNRQSITLPSGKAKFNWIDVKNIAEAIAILIKDFEKHINKAYELTGAENLHFSYVTSLITEITGRPIRFISVNPIGFYFKKRSEGLSNGFAFVMTMLHFLPRFQPAPVISNVYEELTGKPASSLRDFIQREKEKMLPPKEPYQIPTI
jgi:uncharacterized protein YbjT (DUF2867 family)